MTDDASTSSAGAVFRLVYRSRDRIPMDERKTALGDLFTIARARNKERDVTGALLISAEYFVQTLEGDEQAVRHLFDRIERDPRHDDVVVLEAREVASRAFPRWSMAEVAEDGHGDDGPYTYLISTQTGAAAAVSRGTSPVQQAALSSMREAMHGETTST